jgi:tripartite-type tricarboxylate transporter receptor subunit TctC
VQQVATGKVKGYGVTSRDRLPDLPDTESLAAALGPKLDIVYWQALYAPAGTPQAVIKTLNDALQETVSDPAVVKAWAAQNVSPFPDAERTPAAGTAFLRSEINRWGQVIRENDIHLEQ